VPIIQPYLRYVNQDSITHVARAIDDTNPLFTDPEYAHGGRFGTLVAPQAILYAPGWGARICDTAKAFRACTDSTRATGGDCYGSSSTVSSYEPRRNW
jgi:hypothetical protein